MNKNLPSYIAGASLVVAVACIAATVSTLGKASKAENDAMELRAQIARMKAIVPDMDIDAAMGGAPLATNDVAELLSLLAKKDAEVENLLIELARNQMPKEEQEQENERPKRESFEERMAKMKAEDPEGYAKMIKEREERQQSMRYNLAERTATFMDLDTSTMTEEERANHDLLVSKMANVWALTEQFQDPEAAPDRDAMRELFTQMRDVRPLMDQERTVMFKQLGTDLGYEGEDAQAFAAHVEDIISATSLQVPGGRGGSGGGRGGNRGGGGGDGGGGR
ncbi:hypothetical protein PDESU_00844 [Pontiella desulfatans]|uniref:Uncharacterized protein n=1 Tax=Pontiella desulfatans TaxID=2750659 RepID=A0A6C2TXF3_PONDE|nr:hypothetical protein [Pontiella desulfatans]VGO12293.1 hypothetical protein PDESU_00844 [Pontiella desulfatans]